MANEHLQKYLRFKPEVTQIFEDLETYKEFCRNYGYAFDERHLYNERSPYAEYIKMTKGREPWDQWRTPRRFNRDHNRDHHRARA